MPLVSTSWIAVWIPTKKFECTSLMRPQSIGSSCGSDPGHMDLVEETTIEETVNELLEILNVKSRSTVHTSQNGNFKLVQFCIPSGDVEPTLIRMQQFGIGNRDYTSVSVFPASIHFESGLQWDQNSFANEADEEVTRFEKAVGRFYSSVKSRLLVDQVNARIREESRFTFDYLVLLLLAAAISFLALIENSSVILVASMLVSPMIGPILGGVFGTAIQDKSLRNYGIAIELLSILICILTGFMFGLICCPFVEHFALTQLPTLEMVSRGRPRNLVIGIFIAIPSGAGIALSVLADNNASLVGVAISASLLPPAVNAGFLWALAIVSKVNDRAIIGWSFNQTFADSREEVTLFTPVVFGAQDWAIQMMILGLVSLLLTVANIICIYLTGILILKIKEITPEKIPQKFSQFWKRDIKAHRDYYKTIKPGEELLEVARDILKSELPEGLLEGTFLQRLFEQAHHENNLNIKNWIAHSATTTTQSPDPASLKIPMNPLSTQLSYSGFSDVSGGSNWENTAMPNVTKAIQILRHDSKRSRDKK